MIETRKPVASGLAKPGRWLLKLLVGLEPGRALRTRLGAGLALLALLAFFGVLGYALPALISAYGGE